MTALLITSLNGRAQLTLPNGSQKASVSQRIGITDICISYSRPAVNEREIWGKLVPYGMNNLGFGTAVSSPWRAGADENTVASFSHDVTVEGQPLSAGEYGLHMIIEEGDKATVIFSRNHTAWGSYFYDPAEDALRVSVETREIPHTEELTYLFTETTPASTLASLNWEKKQVPFRIGVEVSKIVLADIRQKLQGSAGFSRETWEQAAAFSMNNGGDAGEAMGWVDQAREGPFIGKVTYGNTVLKMQLLLKTDKKKEALDLVEEAAAMADTNELNNLGYTLLNIGEHDLAIKYFKINVKNNPTDPNVYDSLGEAYKTVGDTKNAVKNLRMSLSLNPPPGVKANSEKLLKEMGVTL